MQTKISVVIPTHDRPKLLIRCLRALCAQTLAKESFEVIVTSDGPDKNTAAALRPWLRNKKLNLTYLSTYVKKGPAAARNMGWLSAKSPLVAFTDDDCLPEKEWLSAFLDAYDGDPFVAFTGRTNVPLPSDPTDFALNTARLGEAEFITANCACTKHALLKTGGFDERFKLAWREDSDLHFKLLEINIPVIKVNEAVVIHPVRPARWGVSIKEQKKAAYEALLFSKYPELYKRKIGIGSLWNYYLINILWLVLAASLITRHMPIFRLSAVLLGILLLAFAVKRLRNSSRKPGHIIEMLSTSIVIPTLSIYWRLYGAIKYRVLFI